MFLDKTIKNLIANLPKYDSQSVSFLGDKITPSIRNQFCVKLISDLTGAEQDFELPEIITGLNRANCVVPGLIDKIRVTPGDSVFKLNHCLQAVQSAQNTQNTKKIDEISALLVKSVKSILEGDFETNYLAVAFEGLTFIPGLLNSR